MTVKSVIWKRVSRKQRTMWIHSEGYCLRVNWNKQIYGAQQWKERAIAGANMPGACLTSIQIKSLIALIISVPLHFKQPLALPKHFNCMLAELWACSEETSGRVIKGRRKQRCKPAFSGESVQMNIQRSKMEQLQVWVCTSSKYLSPSIFNSCEWNRETMACLCGLEGSKPHSRTHEAYKRALTDEQDCT